MAHYLPEEETLEPEPLRRLQRARLAKMLDIVLASNPFYRAKLSGIEFDPLDDPIDKLPFTTRAEIERDQREHPPYGANLTFPLDQYVRLHQTSGSGGTPLRCLDTAENWQWWMRCWRIIYAAANVAKDDRLFFPFSFGPFIGFWGAFEAAAELGCLRLAAGGMTTSARLRYLLDNGVTFICCTPTYALRMAEVASQEGFDIASSPVRGLLIAGEPGGGIPATRKRIETAWGARVYDHAGLTELGPWGFESHEAPNGLHVLETEFIAEVIDPDSGGIIDDERPGELVMTNLGRIGCPLIRYRTGDQVCLTRGRCIAGRWFAWAERGVIGRIDDMIHIRGNNVFPAAIEGILREFEDVAEFRIAVEQRDALADLAIEIEPAAGKDSNALVENVTNALRDRLHFRSRVRAVEPGSLPRFEMKARRVVRM